MAPERANNPAVAVLIIFKYALNHVGQNDSGAIIQITFNMDTHAKINALMASILAAGTFILLG